MIIFLSKTFRYTPKSHFLRELMKLFSSIQRNSNFIRIIFSSTNKVQNEGQEIKVGKLSFPILFMHTKQAVIYITNKWFVQSFGWICCFDLSLNYVIIFLFKFYFQSHNLIKWLNLHFIKIIKMLSMYLQKININI